VLLPNTSLRGAETVAEIMRERIEHLQIPHQGNTSSPYVTISLGVCVYRGGSHARDEIFDRADKALYRAKESGRNAVVCYPERGEMD
jgi:diguanylate cyclase (GGDEF)-like protein